MARSSDDRAALAFRYELAFERVASHFIPMLLRAGRLASGHRALDVGTGTGMVADFARAAVGPDGHVTAVDLSPDMAERAWRRLSNAPNVAVGIEDGQALSFADGSFDSVLCSLALMFFPDPARGLAEFRRVLRPGGWAAVSVNTVPERSYTARVYVIMARYVPSLAPAIAQTFALGAEARLRELYATAGFREVEVVTAAHRFPVGSFQDYFAQFELGLGSAGQAYLSLSEEARQAVREEVRADVGDGGGPLDIEVEFRIASGRR